MGVREGAASVSNVDDGAADRATPPSLDTVLDLRHLRCPLPVLRTRKALRDLKPGAVIVVHCTDPLAGIDIPHLLNQTADRLLASEHRDDVLVFTIEKRQPGA